MAEVAKPEATKDNVPQKAAKPDKPDEDVYKKELAAAEKALEAARARVVSFHCSLNCQLMLMGYKGCRKGKTRRRSRWS
jgi:hypothetical protein